MACLQICNRCVGIRHLSQCSCKEFVKDCREWVKENYIYLNKEKLRNNNMFALGLHTEGNRMIVIIFHKLTIHQQVAGEDAVCLSQKSPSWELYVPLMWGLRTKVQLSSVHTSYTFIDWQHPRASHCLQISSWLETGFNYQTVSPHQNAKQEHRVSGQLPTGRILKKKKKAEGDYNA